MIEQTGLGKNIAGHLSANQSGHPITLAVQGANVTGGEGHSDQALFGIAPKRRRAVGAIVQPAMAGAIPLREDAGIN